MSMELPSITNVPSFQMNEKNTYIIPKFDLPRDISSSEMEMKLANQFRATMRRAFTNPLNTRAV